MVDFSDSKAERERIIFKIFVEAIQLPVVSGSIRSLPPSNRPPLNPDILCEIHGRGSVAFELVEIVTSALVREMENGQKLKKAFAAGCESYPEIADNFRDALIYVGFSKNALLLQRLEAVSIVVAELRKQSGATLGNIQVPSNLRKVVFEISVTRGVSDGPAFDVMDMTEHTEEIFGQIGKKCKKEYSRDHPIELLAHYTTQSSSDSFNWQSEFHDYVLKILSGSPFERVWVYDNWSKAIKYVYPG